MIVLSLVLCALNLSGRILVKKTFLLFALILVASACNKDNPRPPNCGDKAPDINGSCWMEDRCWDLECKDLNQNGVCFADGSTEHRDREDCEKHGGMWYFDCPCPRTGTIGACRSTAGEKGRAVTTWLYKITAQGKQTMTVQEHEKICTMNLYNSFIFPPQ